MQKTGFGIGGGSGALANPYAALFIGTCAVSTGAIFARIADAPALTIAAYRLGIAVLILAPAAVRNSRGDLARLQGKDIALAVLSGFFLSMHFATWISSLDYTSITNSVVLVNTNPLWVGLMTPLIARESMSTRMKTGIALSVAGGIVIGSGDMGLGKTALFGDMLALAGSVCAAFYLLLGRRLRAKLTLMSYILICYGSAAVILWTIGLTFRQPFTGFTTETYAAMVGMAVVSQVIGHTSYNWALRWFSAGTVAISLLGEPVLATVFAYLFFDEGLPLYKAIGGVLILTAIYLAATNERKQV